MESSSSEDTVIANGSYHRSEGGSGALMISPPAVRIRTRKKTKIQKSKKRIERGATGGSAINLLSPRRKQKKWKLLFVAPLVRSLHCLANGLMK